MTLLSRRAFLASIAAAGAAAATSGVALASQRRVSGRVDLAKVASVAIHPAVGIARVGNSEDAFFFGPEVPGALPEGPFKDAAGAMAKQAARFRVYGYDADGRVLGEITAADAEITWSAILGNGKASWYAADEPLDVPGVAPIPIRNPGITDRRSLTLLSRPTSVQGPAAAPRRLSGATFLGTPVALGEILTDADGRLIVLPGSGRAVQAPGAPPLSSISDNSGWTDTTADGPIFATVRVGDRVLQATPARVVCASPNYGPGIATGLTTLYDTVLATLVLAGRRRRSRTDYFRDVEPIFERMTDLQWVNAGYLTTNGFGSLRDWTTPEWQARLSDGSPANGELRRSILAMFRDPFFGTVQPSLEPQEYGDLIQLPPTRTVPRQWTALSPVQYAHLRSWAEGDFTTGTKAGHAIIEAAPLDEQPAMLDRAALDACLGGAFHPGIEFPWIARVHWIWTDDLRLRSAAKAPNLEMFGDELAPEVALSRSGPLRSIGPGDVIQWMGLPWQADSANCRYGYFRAVSDVLPGFWPARIPNSVLTAQDYEIVMDSGRSLDDRRAAFARREQWERYIALPNRIGIMPLMVSEWSKLGVVRERPGPADGAFPKRLKVETGLGFSGPAPDAPASANRVETPRFPLVVTNSDDNLLRSIAQDGTVSGLATSTPLARPEGIACDAMGNLFVAAMDANAIVRVARDGTVTTIATGLTTPLGVTCDAWGNVYAGGIGGSGWVVQIAPDGTVTELVNGGAAPILVHAVAIAPDGALLISDNSVGRIMRYDPLVRRMLDPNWITGLARPKTMAWDREGALYVVERAANTVSRFDSRGKRLPFALSGVALDGPFGIAYDGFDRMFVGSANPAANRIDTIALQGDQGVVATFATGMRNPGGLVFQGNLAPVPMTGAW